MLRANYNQRHVIPIDYHSINKRRRHEKHVQMLRANYKQKQVISIDHFKL